MEPERGRSIPGLDGAWPRPCLPPGAGSTASTHSTIRSKGVPPHASGIRCSCRPGGDFVAESCGRCRTSRSSRSALPCARRASPAGLCRRGRTWSPRAVCRLTWPRPGRAGTPRSWLGDRGICTWMQPRPSADSGEGPDPHARPRPAPAGMALSHLPDGRQHRAALGPSRDSHPRRMGRRMVAHEFWGPVSLPVRTPASARRRSGSGGEPTARSEGSATMTRPSSRMAVTVSPGRTSRVTSPSESPRAGRP